MESQVDEGSEFRRRQFKREIVINIIIKEIVYPDFFLFIFKFL